MKFPTFHAFNSAVRKGREALRRKSKAPLPGRFQTFSHTLPDRYPWLFEFTRSLIDDGVTTSLLSFGCSRGDEVFSLRKYFPQAAIKGVDIDPHNIEHCVRRARLESAAGITFEVAARTDAEKPETYDAIFCLAVLCNGNLTTSGAQNCDPHLRFADFESVVTDFARCLKPGGLLLLHTTNFIFGDTAVAQQFGAVLKATPKQLASDVLFDRNNRLLPGIRYYDVGFRKCARSDR
jgi:SAM-dependent methyltransferase